MSDDMTNPTPVDPATDAPAEETPMVAPEAPMETPMATPDAQPAMPAEETPAAE